MSLNALIQRATLSEPYSEARLDQEARGLGVSIHSLCDAFAREVAEGYLRGDYSWEVGDIAMNSLYSSAYGIADFGLPDFATRVFEAFDEGEYIHRGEPRENDGEPRTRALLAPLIGGTGV